MKIQLKKIILFFLLLILFFSLDAQENRSVVSDGSYFEGEKIEGKMVGEWLKFDVNNKLI